jgi:beta-glucosidase
VRAISRAPASRRWGCKYLNSLLRPSDIFIMGVRSILSALNALLCVHWVAAGNSVTSSPSYPSPSGYSTQVYNVSAATTILTYNYTNEELAMLWNQIGQVAIGPITTTVSPTPEPSAYPRPGSFHPQVNLLHSCTLQN